ncbi:uncharacterized protein LOC141799884 [Halichoeres trimaculatus]|uniref:uncharacterized protein LOC141799884 n=1 Tax=Halichoeres trimaculatus TaxID=147232 RepID=UPI003D9E241C
MKRRGLVKPGVDHLDKWAFTAFLRRPRDRSQNHRLKMEQGRASFFTRDEQAMLLQLYEEVKHIIHKKGNTSVIKKEREKAWQLITDRLNATNLSGQKRTWQQVKTKYKNILQSAVKKKTHQTSTGGGPPSQALTPAEELALDLNKGRPVMKGIQGGTVTDSVLATERCAFLQVSGDTVLLLEPPEDDPGEGTSAAAECTSVDEETLSVDSRRHEDLETAPPQNETGNINAQTIRVLYAKHLQKQVELAGLKIQREKRNLEAIDLDIEIKKRKLKILDMEIQKFEREGES